MQLIKQVKCELTSAEEKRIIDAITKGTHDNDEIIDLINDFIDEAFHNGLEYNGEG